MTLRDEALRRDLAALIANPSGEREWHNQGRSGWTPVVDVSRLRALLAKHPEQRESDPYDNHDRRILEDADAGKVDKEIVVVRCPHRIGLAYQGAPAPGMEDDWLMRLPCPCNERSEVVAVIEPVNEGCDCTELCEMGPTCPGGMLARLPGSGCWRTDKHPERRAVDGCAVVGCDEEGLWWSDADEVWFCETCAHANMPSVCGAVDVEALAEVLCAEAHPELAGSLVRHPEAVDPRNRVTACFACQRVARALAEHLAGWSS